MGQSAVFRVHVLVLDGRAKGGGQPIHRRVGSEGVEGGVDYRSEGGKGPSRTGGGGRRPTRMAGENVVAAERSYFLLQGGGSKQGSSRSISTPGRRRRRKEVGGSTHFCETTTPATTAAMMMRMMTTIQKQIHFFLRALRAETIAVSSCLDLRDAEGGRGRYSSEQGSRDEASNGMGRTRPPCLCERRRPASRPRRSSRPAARSSWPCR